MALSAAYYSAPISAFRNQADAEIIGHLSSADSFDITSSQRRAWQNQIQLLKQWLEPFDHGNIFFEFRIPRMGKRADVVLLMRSSVWVLEFKAFAEAVEQSALLQVHDYALDLKNFHRGSHDLPIVPLAIATAAKEGLSGPIATARDGVAYPIGGNGSGLAQLITRHDDQSAEKIDPVAWCQSGYLPTPTIIEAAQALYQEHDVQEISRSDSGAQNLAVTSGRIDELAHAAEAEGRKKIIFVTGVPGSGKTLCGLNIATERSKRSHDEPAVFLSGNGPLVDVLREALARDEVSRTGTKKGDAKRKVSSFIQNIHHFRDEALKSKDPPPEHIVIFDEAQRAWSKEQAAKFMQQKRSIPDFDKSEPQFLIEVMDRTEDWAVIVCLIGGGQEINTGEAGLGEWLSALRTSFPDWQVHMSDRLSGP
ncbi:MAG: DNA/RNA helicase domain-containing protein, partial [Parvularcula sp.]|nr:DNA/RNA helicase domain-containing protein [Parvularcula sp.]